MPDQTAQTIKGPPSYFPSIESKYGKSIAQWLDLLSSSGIAGHMALVDWLKTEHAMGHGHANALVAYHLTPEKWPQYQLVR